MAIDFSRACVSSVMGGTKYESSGSVIPINIAQSSDGGELMSNQLLRDFLWCIESRDMLDLSTNFFKTFTDSVFSQPLRENIERSPEKFQVALESRLSQLKTRRLGERFEAFWEVAFDWHPEFELVAKNYVVRHDKVTLGELDFIVLYRPDKTLHHIELTCKFYLEVPGVHSLAKWMGPGQADRLDKKLHRLQSHQLPLISDPKVKTELTDQGWTNLHSHSVFKGKLFAPMDVASTPIEAPVNSQTMTGQWATRQMWLSRYESKPYRWKVLTKKDWFAKSELDAVHPIDKLLTSSIEFPIKIAGFNDSGEQVRGFVVEDDWLVKAHKKLA